VIPEYFNTSKDPKNLDVLRRAQINMAKVIASETKEILKVILSTFFLSLTSYIQNIAGTMRLNRHTRMFKMLRRKSN